MLLHRLFRALLTAEDLAVHLYTPGAGHPVHVVRGLSFEVERGEIVALLGPSGGGKTTLLRTLAGAVKPSGGRITWQHEARPSSWYSPQSPQLLGFRSALANVCLSREARRRLRSEDVSEGYTLLNHVQIAPDKRSGTLSGGMKRRVALAQALYSEADLLLLDEPFAELDIASRREAEKAFFLSVAARDRTVVFATHDLDSATALATKVLIVATEIAGRSPCLSLTDLFEGEVGPSSRREKKHFVSVVGRVQEFMTASLGGAS